MAVKRQDLFSGLSSTGYVDAASLAATAAELRMQRADGNLSDSGNQMIYARVAANCSPPEGQTLYHVPLEAGNGEIMSVLSTQVYYFQNSAGVNNQPTDTFSVGPPTQNLEAARGSSRGLTQVQPVPAIHGPLNGNAGDVLGPGQFVSAVQDLLSAAGLPLDLERLQLLNQAASLKEALTLAERKLDKVNHLYSRNYQMVYSSIWYNVPVNIFTLISYFILFHIIYLYSTLTCTIPLH